MFRCPNQNWHTFYFKGTGTLMLPRCRLEQGVNLVSPNPHVQRRPPPIMDVTVNQHFIQWPLIVVSGLPTENVRVKTLNETHNNMFRIKVL